MESGVQLLDLLGAEVSELHSADRWPDVPVVQHPVSLHRRRFQIGVGPQPFLEQVGERGVRPVDRLRPQSVDQSRPLGPSFRLRPSERDRLLPVHRATIRLAEYRVGSEGEAKLPHAGAERADAVSVVAAAGALGGVQESAIRASLTA